MTARRDASRLNRTVWILGPVGWLIIATYLAASIALGPKSDGNVAQVLLVWSLTVFFAVLLIRLLCAAIANPKRRAALLVLMVSVALWAAGASVVNASKLSETPHFPAPGEWLFLASYVGMACFLIIDERHRVRRGLATWLDVIVICGGTACVSASLILLPVASQFGNGGLPLLLGMLYPVLEIALTLLVVAQVVLRIRPSARQAATMCAGFLLLAFADGQFVTSAASATYTFSAVLDVIWASAFALIVGNACRSRRTVLAAVPRRQGPAVMVAAGAAATVALALPPSAGIGPFLTAAATITLAAAGGQLVLALKEAKKAAEALALSTTDDLTMLPNRRAVRNRLDELLESPAPLALMILDMDGFKEINDTLGHAAGDTVLQLAAHRMRSAMPSSAMIARLGGDEFAFVMPTEDEIALLEAAKVVLDALAEPLSADGIEIALSASIGITVRAESDRNSGELLRRADIAMYQAKLCLEGAVLYDPHHDDFSRPRLQLAEELRRGIPSGQLVLWYQPQIDSSTMQVCGLEALIRWNHPTHGMLSPAEFLPVARRAGLMLMLSDEVARHAVAAAKRLNAHGLHQPIAINCAPPELLSGFFIPRLYSALESADVPASSLIVEITEDSLLADPVRARTILQEMREHGLQISIDDYGTGFSSLSYLRDLPVEELKIDRSFIARMLTDQRSRTIVESTLQMAHGLGLRIVAEGVEDAPTASELVAMGVDVLQGYHIARPMPLSDVQAWISEWSAVAEESPWRPRPETAELFGRAATRSTRVEAAPRWPAEPAAVRHSGTHPVPALSHRPDRSPHR